MKLTSQRANRRDMLKGGGALAAGIVGAQSQGNGRTLASDATPAATPVPDGPKLTGIVFSDEEMDAQLLRALDTIYVGGADFGECFVTARAIHNGDTDAWLTKWQDLGDRMTANASASLANGSQVSARESLLRAVTYYRTSSIFLYRPPLDPAFVNAFDLQRDAFQQAAPLSEWTIEIVQIPYEDTTLEGYLLLTRRRGPVSDRGHGRWVRWNQRGTLFCRRRRGVAPGICGIVGGRTRAGWRPDRAGPHVSPRLGSRGNAADRLPFDPIGNRSEADRAHGTQLGWLSGAPRRDRGASHSGTGRRFRSVRSGWSRFGQISAGTAP